MRFSLGVVQLSQRLRHVLAHRRAVVPQELVLHIADTFAFNGVRDNATRAAYFKRHLSDGLFDCVNIVALELADCPSKSPPFVGQRVEIDYVLDCAEALNFVVVDEDNEVVELMVRRKERGFPNGTFIAFAVANQAEDAAGAAVAFSSDRHSRGDRKAVTERARRKLDAGNVFVHYVTGEGRTILIEGFEALDWEIAVLGKDSIERRAGVTFAHDETVTIGPIRALRIVTESAPVNGREEFRGG